MRKHHAPIRGGAHIFQANGPAQFVTNKLADLLFRKNHPHRFAHQLHAVAVPRDAVAKLEIIGVMVRHRLPAPNFRQALFSCRHRPAVSELHFLFEPPRNQCAGRGIQAHSQRTQARCGAALRDAPVESCDRAHLRIRERRRSHLQIIRFYSHIAVAHDHKVILRFLHQPAQAVHLAVGSNSRDSLDQPDGAAGEIRLQLPDNRHCRIINIGHGKNNFVFRVIQAAKAGEILVGILVHSAHGL